jgi:hypothetical protein
MRRDDMADALVLHILHELSPADSGTLPVREEGDYGIRYAGFSPDCLPGVTIWMTSGAAAAEPGPDPDPDPAVTGRAEYCIFLPSDFPRLGKGIRGVGGAAERSWPIRCLAATGAVASVRGVWPVPGGLIVTRELDAAGGSFGGLLVVRPFSLPRAAARTVAGGEQIELLCLVPVHRDEMEYNGAHGEDQGLSLMELIRGAGYSEVVDLTRPSVCAARH